MNVKPGDLAIIVGATKHFGAIGSIVYVVEPAPICDAWKVGFQGILPASLNPNRDQWVLDCHLRPVSGLPDTEQTDQQEPIKEIA